MHGIGKGCTHILMMSSGSVYGETIGQVAVLCRCNFTVFSEAVKKCCYAGETNIRVAFVGVSQ